MKLKIQNEKLNFAKQAHGLNRGLYIVVPGII
jgi:hypothetical protein